MSDKHPPQQTVSSSEAGAPEATILRGTSKATTPPLRGTSKATTPPLRGTPPSLEGSRKNSPPEKGEYPEGGRGLIPKLRFPEFREAGEWDEKKLFQVCEINPSVNTLPETFVYIDLESVEQGKLLQKKTILRKSAPSRAQRLLKPGDIIFQMVRPYQKNNYFFMPDDDHDYVASTGYAQLRANQSNKYLFHYLHNDKFVRRVLEQCTGSNYPAINSSDLSAILVELPEQNEQQKIADCLSSLDTLITAQTEKIDALKTHKKGLMQQLFPQDGETVPRLRFSEFREAGEWEAKTLGDIARITSGGTPNRAEPSYWGGSIPWVTTSLIDFNRIDRTEEFITAEGLANSSAKLFPAQTLLMAMYGQGKTRGKVALLGIESTTNQACAAITFNDEVDTNFAFQNLASRYDEIRKLSNEGGQENLSAGLIKSILLAHPCLAEQQKIADCLSSLDTLIAAETEKLDALKTHKKGLMQQLFPTVENEAGS